MHIRGNYIEPPGYIWALRKSYLPKARTLAEFFSQPQDHPAQVGPIGELGVQPLVHFGTQAEGVELRGENVQTALLLHLYRLVTGQFNSLSEKEIKLIPTLTGLAQEAGIRNVREAIKETRTFQHLTQAISAAMVADKFENHFSSALLKSEGFGRDLLQSELIEKGWNPYQWQGSFPATAQHFLEHPSRADLLLPLGPLVDFTGFIPPDGDDYRRWSRVTEASLLHKSSNDPDVQHVDWIWQHPAYLAAAEKLKQEERAGLLTHIAGQLERHVTERNRSKANSMQAGLERAGTAPGSGLAALISQLDTRLGITEDHQRKEAVFFGQWQATAKLFPYLRPLMSEFTLSLDRSAALRLNVGRAAVDPQARVLYLNKGNIDPDRWSDGLPYLYPLMMLKIALGHHERAGGKDPFLWDMASEILLTGWLMPLGISIPRWAERCRELEGLPSVEAIYLRLLEWPKKEVRRLSTVRGPVSSVLSQQELTAAEQADRDAALLERVREGVALAQAMEGASWGDHGAGLERALLARVARPLPWKPAFAEYLQEITPTAQRERTYAKLSRRVRHREEPKAGRRRVRQGDTHNLLIIVDTSGSMSDDDLQDGLGAIRSTASALSINAIRLFACDAQVRDYGWEAPWHAGGQVVLHGGGGTNLDPALHLIDQLTQEGEILPEQPLLIITDGLFAGEIRTAREHAYLLPKGAALAYRTAAPIFHMQREE
ncbi:hypothetical protein [Deinococcus sp. PESE-13]